MMDFSIFIVFVKPNVVARSCFSGLHGQQSPQESFNRHQAACRATARVAPTIYELRVRHSVMENEQSGAYQPEAPVLHDGTRLLVRQLSVLLAELQAISPLPSDAELVALPEEGSRRLDKYVELLEAIRQETHDDLPFLLERLKDEVPAVRTAALLYGIALLAQVYPLPQAIPVVAELLDDEQASVREHAREVMATLRG